jgi:DNA-directed RNA polymerase subunit RPC12/RpoP
VGKLSCNNCGALIELPDSANYATCASCGARLVVRRGEMARYTEVLADSDVVQHVADTEAELSRMRIEMAIMALDQEWEGRHTQMMVHNRYGAEIEPRMSQVAFCLLGSLMLPVGAIYAMIR